MFWSIGNEIPEDGTPQGVETARKLAERVRMLDPTRPVTQAINADPPKSTNQAAVLDVVGYNYHAAASSTKEHEQLPELTMYTSESLPKDAFSYWRAVETMPWVIGDFVWTAVDYLGESGIGWMGYSQDWQKLGPYPWHLAYCGEIDATGRKRPAAYYRQVVWKTGIDPIAAFVRQPEGTEDLPDRHLYPITPPHLDWSLDDVHPSWTWPGQEGKPQEVVVYSELPEVELFLNGNSLGRKPSGWKANTRRSTRCPTRRGSLSPSAIATAARRAAGNCAPPARRSTAVVSVDRHAGQRQWRGPRLRHRRTGRCRRHARLCAGRRPEGARERVAGRATLAGIGNGNPVDVSSFQSGERKTFHGRAVAVVRAGTAGRPDHRRHRSRRSARAAGPDRRHQPYPKAAVTMGSGTTLVRTATGGGIYLMLTRRELLQTGAAAALSGPVIAAPSETSGPFTGSWQSLASGFRVPDWFRDAKLGIWAHWGPQCQPEYGDWYAPLHVHAGPPVVEQGESPYENHVSRYGHPSGTGFLDIIGQWKAENWDPKYLIRRYAEGRRALLHRDGCHHDNLDLFDSKHHGWNSLRVGPKHDIVGTWEPVVREAGLKFGISNHAGHAWHWYQPAYGYDPKGR